MYQAVAGRHMAAGDTAGQALDALTAQFPDVESESLLEQLLPLFDAAGFPISITTPEHWYLQLPRAAPLPEFSTPEQGMGEDVFRHLPDGPEGKRWRALLKPITTQPAPYPLRPLRTCKPARYVIAPASSRRWASSAESNPLPAPERHRVAMPCASAQICSAIRLGSAGVPSLCLPPNRDAAPTRMAKALSAASRSSGGSAGVTPLWNMAA